MRYSTHSGDTSRGSSSAGRDGDHMPARSGLADLSEVRRGIIRVANCQHRHFELVANASMASKIDFGTPHASSTKISGAQRESPGMPIDHDPPACDQRSHAPLVIELDTAGEIPLAMSLADEAPQDRVTCFVVGPVAVANGSSLVWSHHATAQRHRGSCWCHARPHFQHFDGKPPFGAPPPALVLGLR